MQSVQSGTKKKIIKCPPPILGLKETTFAVFPTTTCKSYVVPFFFCNGTLQREVKP